MKQINCKGQVDYDYKNDILFFKTKDREYDKSIEVDNVVLDIDTKGFITGIQLFEASEFLNLKKVELRDIPHWKFNTKAELVKQNGQDVTRVEIRLAFNIRVRNTLIEKNPIIIPHPIKERLPDSELHCAA